MLSLLFLAPIFAVAGLAAAAGPLLIHLLNRRRFRVLRWAAMDFLREAVRRNRRILQIRDLLLLALRMAAVVLFGLALAQPYWMKNAAPAAPDQPVHAVVLLDNSLSMGYEELDGTLLDQAKAKVKEIIERLPQGSRISILPTCGPASQFSVEAYASPEEALEAVGRIKPVDRAARPDATIDMALEACGRLPTMAAKQIYLVSDERVERWPGEAVAEHLRQLPSPLQVVEVAAKNFENAWVADFKLRDGMADLQSPGVFLATIGYEGARPRQGLEVKLSVEGTVVATQSIDLEPGQTREIQFPPYRFEAAVEPGKVAYVTAEVSISADHLAIDNHRFLAVPVLAAVPVVFVDACGPQEDPRRNVFGETRPLRRLLAPLGSRSDQEQPLVKVRHLKIDQLDRQSLADARAVVIAGVSNPQGAVPLLREYVRQGGNLIVAAGGNFDPAAWSAAGWAGGNGILPAPLAAAAVGKTPEETTGQLQPFFLDYDSLVHQYFLVEGADEEELRDLYREPFFFKAVATEMDEDAQDAAAKTLAEQLQAERETLAQINGKLAELAKREAGPQTSAAGAADHAELDRERAELEDSAPARPNWLLWNPPGDENLDPPVEEEAQRCRAQVLGRYSNGLPFFVRRRLGRGQVLLVTTGLASGAAGWNTLARSNAVLIYDRMVRSMLLETLPARNLSTEAAFVLPVAAAERHARFALVGPAGQEHALSVDAQSSGGYGITLGPWQERGIYRVIASRSRDAAAQTLETTLWETPLAINGPSEAAQAARPPAAGQPSPTGQQTFLEAARVVAGDTAPIEFRLLWFWILIAVLLALAVESALLAATSSGGERTK